MTGEQAYRNGNAHLYLSGSDEFRSEYKEAFDADLPASYDDLSREVAFDQHYFDDIEPAYKAMERAKDIAARNTAVNILMLALGFVLCWAVTR